MEDKQPLDLEIYRQLKQQACVAQFCAALRMEHDLQEAAARWERDHKILRFPVERVTP